MKLIIQYTYCATNVTCVKVFVSYLPTRIRPWFLNLKFEHTFRSQCGSSQPMFLLKVLDILQLPLSDGSFLIHILSQITLLSNLYIRVCSKIRVEDISQFVDVVEHYIVFSVCRYKAIALLQCRYSSYKSTSLGTKPKASNALLKEDSRNKINYMKERIT